MNSSKLLAGLALAGISITSAMAELAPKMAMQSNGKEVVVTVRVSKLQPGSTVAFTYNGEVKTTYNILNFMRIPTARVYTRTPLSMVLMGTADSRGTATLTGRAPIDYGEGNFNRSQMIDMVAARVCGCSLYAEPTGQRWRFDDLILPVTSPVGNR